MAGVVVGHPLDVVKTRMQAASSPLRGLSGSQCLMTTVHSEGYVGLWRGLAPPLFAVAWYQAIVFASYEWSFKKATGRGVAEERARLGAGALSGAASCLITVPTDAVKIQLQLEQGSGEGAMKDALRCGCRMIEKRGVGSLFNGFTSCLCRDVPATIIYFTSYAQVKAAVHGCVERAGVKFQSNNASHNRTRAMQFEIAAELFAGGVAGVLSWALTVPQDVVKTTIQEAAAAGRPITIQEATRTVLRRDGYTGLMRGFGPLCVRAFPVNAVTFFVYERSKILLGVPAVW
eukprot:gnl/TRDRNA2_/TRDRNA2_206238_c0_seq1.p1 gnl/TRDRNA2_/TRDRNA2_206238_c0~~gnl/TRDRNA2_/TRDRNA2_206238_c0_seq1.p1  ORF type:complete len:325 (-),score=38.89 gnl/TRDRNA2_/TRDRNA2_206238_c0_seq1:282-1148(-)